MQDGPRALNGMHVPGRELGHVRYDQVAQGLGAYGELVEDPRRSDQRWNGQ